LRLSRDHLQALPRSSRFLTYTHHLGLLTLCFLCTCLQREGKGFWGVVSFKPQLAFMRNSVVRIEITNSSPESAPQDRLPDRHDSIAFFEFLLTSRGRMRKPIEMLRLVREYPPEPRAL